ncbi:uncharacterized protein LOC122093769 [Macadamia integrifolia]|uniref:uncharacterized protein LOC122093769 n=1 Tax=Macadamia integrifolia TaxID=60698 RepID=UPI001C52C59F|nr:uncharacterized protein LOC122093769 [Macadamia integrifolia]XP_042520175.1 uncharacterized protein LOC122093769 [Macadamia integrifolia]XP_042520176.1 uncharacterized protein LOC122093769 [Macadamia integrifolia]
MAMTPREHIEEIRKTKFSIGGESNPLTEDLHQAVKNLSAELYAKDVHFLMELIQNAEDNEYPEGVKASLEFIITSRDITATGAAATLLVFNNEKGFSPKNIDSLCSVGRSTKKGNRQRGYIGEKGIGFKSVFLITAQPCIFSNGYQIRFSEDPCPECNVGYIVPEWVEENPSLADIKQIYGSASASASASAFPATTIVLPLKCDKVGPVKQQLSCVHPEVLLFLSKIKRLSIREDNEDRRLNTVNAISISSETDFVMRKNIDAESYTLHLSSEENDDESERECRYHMWRQKFPVRLENRVERKEVEEWMITLAFPYGQRLNRGMNSPGVYAFLPTEMVTNFPFIIQADFILASSRETVRLDNQWNQGILDCVPSAFINAFITLVKTTESAPVSALARMFKFIPVGSSLYPKLNSVREKIKEKLVEENIVPCESYTDQKFFCKPSEVGRIVPAFWNILIKAKEQGVSLQNLSSHGLCVLNSAFDIKEYDDVLNFLGVQQMVGEWYVKCIRSSNLVMGVSEDVYMELLYFLSCNWGSCFCNTELKNIPLLKYVNQDGNVSLLSINAVTQRDGSRVRRSSEACQISWLINWNREFRCPGNQFFLPKGTQEALQIYPQRQALLEWLEYHVEILSVSTSDYASVLVKSLNGDRKLVIALAHFLHHSLSNKYLSEWEVCGYEIPMVDNYGCVTRQRSGVLVPANGSKWVRLIGTNPWRGENYVELGEEYLEAGHFAGVYTSEQQLMIFMKTYAGASDIPDLCPPNAVFPTVSAPLTKENTFLLLDWIRTMKRKGMKMEGKFLRCIKEGSWLRIFLGCSPGYRPPSQSFLLTPEWGNLLQNGYVLVDIPLIDQRFYDDRISAYMEELKTLGVMSEFGEACQFIGKHLMSLAASSNLTRSNVLSMLNFIRFLRRKFLPTEDFIMNIKEGRWLRTSHGVRSPVGSILFDSEWKHASQISDLPFIDQDYYGEEIPKFREELQLLGVIVGFNQNYKLVADYFRLPASLTSFTPDTILFILECIRCSRSSGKVVQVLKDKKWLKTSLGYKSPGECFLHSPEWGCLLQVFSGFPVIAENFYGSTIFSYKNELKEAGVVVDFEVAANAFACYFKKHASSATKENVLSFLSCFRQLKGAQLRFPADFSKCIREEKWLRTCLGNRSPQESILFGPDWLSISPIATLPFLKDDYNNHGKGIQEYKTELKALGVVIEFKEGAKFVTAGIRIPSNPANLTPMNVASLLDCVRNLMHEKSDPLPAEFLKRINTRWLKTHMGYQSPEKCLLFDREWASFLQPEDGPFIDEEFYGFSMILYKKELSAIGVTLDIKNVCTLLASHLEFHSQLNIIARIYQYLMKFNWEPDNKAARWIWIPNGCNKGEWVSPEECILYDRDNLFGAQLNILSRYYEKKLLGFFSMALGVRHNPSIDDYYKLWKEWENSGHQLPESDCCAFWINVAKNWTQKTQKLLADNLLKVPVKTGTGGILLSNKQDVFIPDDLQLKDMFQKASLHPLFVWCPQRSLETLPRSKLLEMYSNVGVRTMSESIEKDESSIPDSIEFKNVNPRDILIREGLLRLILGFLADPSLKMDVERRHQTIKYLLDLSVFKTAKSITVSYMLPLSSGKNVNVEVSQLIRWERASSRLFIQKTYTPSGHKANIEFATYFSKVISEGLLWEKEDQISGLSELIKLGFLLEFEEEAIKFLMKTKNMQLLLEDEEFLASVLTSN